MYQDEAQQRAAAIIPRISGFLSIVGSSLIVYVITSRWRDKLKILYHRILLCMSIMDFISSIGQVLSTAPIPSESTGVYGAIGNQFTCNFQGFVLQLGLAVPLYNLSLSYHYVLSTTDQAKSLKLEPIFHTTALGVPLCLAIFAIVQYNFNNMGSICFLNEHPINCNKNIDVKCTRGLTSGIQRFIIAAIITICFFFITLNMIILYCRVSRQHSKIDKKYNISTSQKNNSFKKKEKAIATQALLYVCSFAITFIWPLVDGFLQIMYPDKRVFLVIVCSKFFYPLQGFFNFLIFIRPRVIRIKRDQPHACYLSVLHQSIFPKKPSQRQTNDDYFPDMPHNSSAIDLEVKGPRRRDSLNIIDIDFNDTHNFKTSLGDNDDSSADISIHCHMKEILLDVISTSDDESIDNKQSLDIDMGEKDYSTDCNGHESTSISDKPEEGGGFKDEASIEYTKSVDQLAGSGSKNY